MSKMGSQRERERERERGGGEGERHARLHGWLEALSPRRSHERVHNGHSVVQRWEQSGEGIDGRYLSLEGTRARFHSVSSYSPMWADRGMPRRVASD